MARLILEGERGQAVVTVRFRPDGTISGFALDADELEGIGTVVMACPQDRRQEMTALYDSVLGTDRGRRPGLRFGEGRRYRPPRWPDPEAPQQMHLDIFVGDLDEVGRLVTAHGASLLHDAGDHRTYADPIGHPFCLYADPSADGPGVLARIVIDCFSPRTLAAFYEGVLGLSARVEDSSEWVVTGHEDGRLPRLAFQHVPHFVAPRWPDPDHPQQVHFDLKFDDRPAAEARALRLGAIPLPPQGGSCPVYADPAGHTLCFCYPGE